MKVIIIVGCFILFDVVTGVIKALYNEGLNSTCARKGMYHKLSEIIAVIGSAGLEYVAQYIELGIDLPVMDIVSAYICIMELISILENLAEINPTLHVLFSPYLEKLKMKVGDNNER